MLEVHHHPLDIITIITAITLIFLIRGFLFRLPLMPLLSMALLELLPGYVFLLFPLLFYVKLFLVFLGGEVSYLMIHLILFHRGL